MNSFRLGTRRVTAWRADGREVEHVLVAGVAADAADEDVVVAGGVDRERVDAGAGVVEAGEAGPGREQLVDSFLPVLEFAC